MYGSLSLKLNQYRLNESSWDGTGIEDSIENIVAAFSGLPRILQCGKGIYGGANKRHVDCRNKIVGDSLAQRIRSIISDMERSFEDAEVCEIFDGSDGEEIDF
jgi:hypothetical protein